MVLYLSFSFLRHRHHYFLESPCISQIHIGHRYFKEVRAYHRFILKHTLTSKLSVLAATGMFYSLDLNYFLMSVRAC